MTNYNRLLTELSNRQYLSEEQYNTFLTEEGLTPGSEYNKDQNQKALLFTIVDILEAVCNDTDQMKKISTEFGDVSQCYSYLRQRIQAVKDRIASIPDPEEEYSAFSLMYTRGGIKTRGGYFGRIDSDKIASLS